MGEPNRAGLIQMFKLREDADDAQIVAAIRRSTRSSRSFGRPFVLPPDLDLMSCLEAIHQKKLDGIKLNYLFFKQSMIIKQKQRSLDLRCLLINFILDASGIPRSHLEED